MSFFCGRAIKIASKKKKVRTANRIGLQKVATKKIPN